ncbi:MAG: PaaI family thioesterase [Pseudomonadota bacterium]
MAGQVMSVARFLELLPHAKALGMQLDSLGTGEATLSMAYAEHLIGDPVTGVVHGGAVSALLDTCCGAAVMSHSSNPAGTATIDLRIEYLRSATPGERITALASCYHITRSVAFVRARALDADPDRPVAMATGTFTVGDTR